ncbi:hypothetical protein SAMN04487859_10569 [Roseovarius lutimaris]|uniref:Uncharacterized protein n=1 Tax=Roseovarius lutimaris TaxID=1005928 RepID=A0A1I5A519_9RHOB|nr:hypothetical protein [Roseovarius lutimaris]SFN57575.1 hypothetical protein SAMN04487859_10569 [Roseovarius lutimaris]
MGRDRWHEIEEEGGALVVARRWPVRFDLAVATRLPKGGRRYLAHLIRQDMWRALQTLRGFIPAVRVTRSYGGLEVVAGGEVQGRFDRADAEARIAAVLEDPANRARWMRRAR